MNVGRSFSLQQKKLKLNEMGGRAGHAAAVGVKIPDLEIFFFLHFQIWRCSSGSAMTLHPTAIWRPAMSFLISYISSLLIILGISLPFTTDSELLLGAIYASVHVWQIIVGKSSPLWVTFLPQMLRLRTYLEKSQRLQLRILNYQKI